jgi:hypothetical protein
LIEQAVMLRGNAQLGDEFVGGEASARSEVCAQLLEGAPDEAGADGAERRIELVVATAE